MKKCIHALLLLIVLLLNPFYYKTSAQNEVSITPNFYEMFENHGSIMMLIDSASGEILYVNESAIDYYGYSREDFKTLNISDINILSNEEIKNEMQAAVREERNFFTFQHRLATGDIRTVEVYSYPYVIDNKPMLYSIINDITDKVLLAEQSNRTTQIGIFSGLLVLLIALFTIFYINKRNIELKKIGDEIANFNKLRESFINADNRLIYLKDENRKYVFVNEAFKKYLNLEDNKILARTDIDLKNTSFEATLKKHEINVIENNTNIDTEVKINNTYFRIIMFPILLLNNAYGVGAYLEDITHIRRMEEIENKTILRNEILIDAITDEKFIDSNVFEYVLEQSLKLTGSEFGYIYLYNHETNDLTLNTLTKSVLDECSTSETTSQSHLRENSIMNKVLKTKEPVIINDFKKVENININGHIDIDRFLTIPILADNNIALIVGLANKEEPYTDYDIRNITILMSSILNVELRKEKAQELAETNKELKASQEQIQLLLDSTVEGIYGIDTKGNCTTINKSGLHLLGYNNKEELLGKNIHELIHYKNKDGSIHKIEDCHVYQAIVSGSGQYSNDEVFWKKDGSYFEAEYYAYPQISNGEIVGAVVTFLDNSERREYENHIKYLSYHDSLTGLYNRMYFEESLSKMDTPENMPLTIIFADVNGLKLTNDVFGHAMGDKLIIKSANAIKSSLRQNDLLARVGGDEFAVILPNTTEKVTKNIITRIQEKMSQIKVVAIKGSISIGSDTKTEATQEIERILQNAEQAMYQDKSINKRHNSGVFINNILEMLFEKSERVKVHSKNVSNLSKKLAKQLDLDQDSVKRISELGRLHDIGKIVFDDSILNNEQALTIEQEKELEQHPATGYRILSIFDETVDLAEKVLLHHEAWDGSGYPKGISGNEIPLEVRIVAVAEAYDSLTNELNSHCYTKQEALEKLKEEAGAKLDPDLVEEFINIIK
jgi:diguanylate cyclase (GGDEF)-like protein/PAS domain S-box-containing protein